MILEEIQLDEYVHEILEHSLLLLFNMLKERLKMI